MRRLKRRKNKKNLQLTDNSKEYKLTKRKMDKIGCPICPPNRGCNRNRHYNNNWKEYRKNQWRE